MEEVHVKNLEKYLPEYKDRVLTWFKFHFRDSLDRKTKLKCKNFFNDEMIEALDEIDKYRYISLIAKEAELGRPVPLDEKRVFEMGWNVKKRPISLTIRMLLLKNLLCDTESNKVCDTESNNHSHTQCNNVCDTDKEEEKEEEKEKEEESLFEKVCDTKKLSQDFFEHISNINPNQKIPNFESWAKDFNLIINSDSRTEEQIRYILEWLFESTHKDAIFWRKNILCPKSLRKHFDRLILIVKDSQPKTNGVNDMIQGLLNEIDKEDLNNAKAV
jgi:hypothetical protein